MKKLFLIFFITATASFIRGMEEKKTLSQLKRLTLSDKPIRKRATQQSQLITIKTAALLDPDSLDHQSLNILLRNFNSIELFHETIAAGNTKFIRALLDNKLVDPNALFDGKRALHKAMEVKDLPIELLKALLDHDSSCLNAKDDEDCFPITRAIQNMYDPRIIEILINYNSPTETRSIMDAAMEVNDEDENHLAILRLLCQKRRDAINMITPEYETNTPLTFAAERGKLKTARVLLEEGANPNSSDMSAPPLFYALCSDKAIEMISLLRQYKVNVDVRASKDVESFLVRMCTHPGPAVTDTTYFIRHGDSSLEGKDTCLLKIEPAYLNSDGIMLRGVNFHITLEAGMTPLDFAEKLYNLKVMTWNANQFETICTLLGSDPVQSESRPLDLRSLADSIEDESKSSEKMES